MDVSAALFGVGYIPGPRIVTIMVSGGLLSSVVIIPILATWGEACIDPLFPEIVKTIAQMSAGAIWNRYVRYIGAALVTGRPAQAETRVRSAAYGANTPM